MIYSTAVSMFHAAGRFANGGLRRCIRALLTSIYRVGNCGKSESAQKSDFCQHNSPILNKKLKSQWCAPEVKHTASQQFRSYRIALFSFLPNTGDRLPGTTLEGNGNFMSLKHNPLRTRDDVPSRWGSREILHSNGRRSRFVLSSSARKSFRALAFVAPRNAGTSKPLGIHTSRTGCLGSSTFGALWRKGRVWHRVISAGWRSQLRGRQTCNDRSREAATRNSAKDLTVRNREQQNDMDGK